MELFRSSPQSLVLEVGGYRASPYNAGVGRRLDHLMFTRKRLLPVLKKPHAEYACTFKLQQEQRSRFQVSIIEFDGTIVDVFGRLA